MDTTMFRYGFRERVRMVHILRTLKDQREIDDDDEVTKNIIADVRCVIHNSKGGRVSVDLNEYIISRVTFYFLRLERKENVLKKMVENKTNKKAQQFANKKTTIRYI